MDMHCPAYDRDGHTHPSFCPLCEPLDPARVAAFNEWMRRYIESPDCFAREFEAVARFLQEQSAGETPSYGEKCEGLMRRIMAELAAREELPPGHPAA